jgi:hypothetical protein
MARVEDKAMEPRSIRFRRLGVGAVAVLLLGITDGFSLALAQDLESGVNTAAGELKRVIKVGLAVAAVVIVAIGLVVTALKFSRKEPDAIWYLLGTGVGSVLCGIAAAML